jgi:hypothetical protein
VELQLKCRPLPLVSRSLSRVHVAHARMHTRAHSHLVGLLCMSDELISEDTTYTACTNTREEHLWPADPCLRLYDHQDQRTAFCLNTLAELPHPWTLLSSADHFLPAPTPLLHKQAHFLSSGHFYANNGRSVLLQKLVPTYQTTKCTVIQKTKQ